MNLNQATIYSDKPLETVDFFLKLGLILIVDSLPRYARLECPDGESTLSVHNCGKTIASNNIVLYFECDDLDGEVERLRSLGLNFEEDPIDRDWLWREAYLRDPNDNKICLFRAGTNRKDPPWKIQTDQLEPA